MREIKFRGKKTDNGYFVYGLPHYSPGNGVWTIVRSNGWTPSYQNPDEGESNEYIQVDPDTIGQYTGLKDKNGVEIYEGDIIKYTGKEYSDDTPAVIVYSGGGFCSKCTVTGDLGDLYDFEVEVIGNMHENNERSSFVNKQK